GWDIVRLLPLLRPSVRNNFHLLLARRERKMFAPLLFDAVALIGINGSLLAWLSRSQKDRLHQEEEYEAFTNFVDSVCSGDAGRDRLFIEFRGRRNRN